MKIIVILTCEHGVDLVPDPYKLVFSTFKNLLKTHRGIDFGALPIAQYLQKKLDCDLIIANTTRLLIDCNRSMTHRSCFSEVTKNLPHKEKKQIIDHYYTPFRQQVTDHITHYIEQGFQIWHLSIHSFTPVMDNNVRHADIAFLYDPKRINERYLAKKWQLELNKITPQYKVRMNYPYKGISDGLTSAMRKQFAPHDYLGIEVESNQAITTNETSLNTLKHILAESLLKVKYEMLRFY